jgi:glycosyltransferase involved in cell wall biosynthesis
MDLSVVIPVYNERDKIAEDISAAREFLRGRGMDGEVVVVDDGSWDDTARLAEAAGKNPGPAVRVLRTPHKGKGHAVRTGMAAAWGNVIGFVDSGMCVPYGDLMPGIEWIRKGKCDIAHGSRRLAESDIRRPQNLRRRFASWAFRRTVSTVFNLPGHLTDTQVGCKLYRRDIAHELYAQCRLDGFAFDLEIILLAKKLGYVIREFPICWSSDPDSRLSFSRTPGRLLLDLMSLKKRFW